MIELKGKYNIAKVFTDVVDEASISQVLLLLNQEFVQGSKIRMMPDIHAGAGCTIGTTMTISDKIVPNLVGVDIGCGMETVWIKEKHIELQKLDKLIYEKIPSGFNIREKAHKYFDEINLEDLYCYKEINHNRAERSLETLSPSTAKRDRAEKKDIYEKAGVEEYWIVSPQGSVEIYYLEKGKYVLEQSYMLQSDKEDEHYNLETIISLKDFPHIKMTLGEIFEGIE